MQNIVQKKTACTRDCPDACGLIVTIDNGRVVRYQCDPDHPVTQGFICQRTSRFPDGQYSRHRLLKPLRRRHKGSDVEEIEWGRRWISWRRR
jgi:anaerobic selenocysteine-containing dehydrogenase